MKKIIHSPQNDQTVLVASIGLRIKSKGVTMVTAAKWPGLGSALLSMVCANQAVSTPAPLYLLCFSLLCPSSNVHTHSLPPFIRFHPKALP